MTILLLLVGIINLLLLTYLLITQRSSKIQNDINTQPFIEATQTQFASQRDQLQSSMGIALTNNQVLITGMLDSMKVSNDQNAQLTRQDASRGRDELEGSLKESLKGMEDKIRLLNESNEKKQDAIRELLKTELETLRKENESKLEQMRTTVDEKLQNTLETRLGASFKSVSDQLSKVYEGLGEMQSLASGVGDLKRVLTNVKNRGGWGEVQLERQLEDMLTSQQYGKNIMVNPESREIVEFAIILPGRIEGEKVYIPIDAKFPQEDYERLLAAQESGNVEEAEKAGKEIEKAIKLEAKTISDKYICPPYSTDFAILYLPTEGLFAEVIRRPGLCNDIQNSLKVMITGPTTLMAILNSLRMGFKTLAVEKKTSEVWQVLSSAQSEFKKYGDVWEKLEKQLSTAQNTVRDARIATKRVERTLDKAELIESSSSDSSLLELDDLRATDTVDLEMDVE